MCQYYCYSIRHDDSCNGVAACSVMDYSLHYIIVYFKSWVSIVDILSNIVFVTCSMVMNNLLSSLDPNTCHKFNDNV